MDPNSNIREYTAEDKYHVLDLLRLNTPEYFSPKEEQDLVHYLDHEIELYYVIETDHRIVGCGGINFNKHKTTGIISWDMLHPEYQGKFLGSLLVKYRMEKLKAIETIQIIRVRTSQKTFRFYEKQGFRLMEVVKDYWAKGFDLYNMEYKQPLK